MASLIARSWREPKRPLAWGYGDWLVLLLVLLAPAQIAAWLVTGWASRAGEKAWNLSMPLVGIAALVGLAAWLAAIVVMALRRRSRLPAGREPGRGRAALAGLRALVLPTIAALLLLSAISLWPVHQRTQETTRQQEATMVQGEVEHWGIGQK
jgi:heme/copper-type cytochrome/quinol oxidase subunit 2